MSGYICLGWGSLLWDPGALPIQGDWQEDGPQLPIEFARISGDGRLTLIVHPQGDLIQTCWTHLDVSNIHAARHVLGMREGCPPEHIGRWDSSGARAWTHPVAVPHVVEWAAGQEFDGIVWTDLPSRFVQRVGQPWSPDAALYYVRSLKAGTLLDRVEEYVRRAPAQTRTRTRSLLEQEFGWTPR